MEIFKDYSHSLEDDSIIKDYLRIGWAGESHDFNGEKISALILDKHIHVRSGKDYSELGLEVTDDTYKIFTYKEEEGNTFYNKDTILIFVESDKNELKKLVATILNKFFKRRLRYKIIHHEGYTYYFEEKSKKVIAVLSIIHGNINENSDGFIYMLAINYFFDPKLYKKFMSSTDGPIPYPTIEQIGIKNLVPSFKPTKEEVADEIVTDLKNKIEEALK